MRGRQEKREERAMTYTVHWTVNDGRLGYPNIPNQLNWSDQYVRSYEEAIKKHAAERDVRDMAIVKEISRGRVRDATCRHYLVTYRSKDGKNSRIDRSVCVFCQKKGGVR
jgi:hypothetical protein